MKEELRQIPLETVLQAYPDISVQRERIGGIYVVQDLPGALEQVSYVFTKRETEDQPMPYVGISVRNLEKEYGKRDSNRPYAYLTLKPVGESDIVVEVEKPQPSVDPRNVITKVRQGLEVFDALLNTPHIERGKFNKRAYDWMAGHDVYQDLKEAGVLAANLVNPSHDLENAWRYMYWMVKKNIAEVREVK